MREDTQNSASEGLGVDDDKTPAPENEQRIEFNGNDEFQYDDWTGDVPGVCERIKNGHRFEKEKLTELVEQSTRLEYFLQIFPLDCTEETETSETSKELGRSMSFGVNSFNVKEFG